jgi:hypothetical protein
MRNTADVTGGKPIAVWWQSIWGVSAINPFTTSMEKRERCYSFILSRTPHETLYYVMIMMWEKVGHQKSTILICSLARLISRHNGADGSHNGFAAAYRRPSLRLLSFQRLCHIGTFLWYTPTQIPFYFFMECHIAVIQFRLIIHTNNIINKLSRNS